MFCPGCGAKEDQPIQFCRSCGASFHQQVDAVTSSAMSAREEIGRAMADKIREFESSKDLKRIAEDVLPELEKFLESPAEKRLRRIRNGTMMMFIGFGVALGFLALALAVRNPEVIFLAVLGKILFFIGLAVLLNGYFATVPKDSKKPSKVTASDVLASSLDRMTSDLGLPTGGPPRPFSVTEGTTTHLGEKQPIRRG